MGKGQEGGDKKEGDEDKRQRRRRAKEHRVWGKFWQKEVYKEIRVKKLVAFSIG